MSEPKHENQLLDRQEDETLRHSARQKTLTEKGQSLYETKVQKFTTTFDRIWKDIEVAIFDYNSKESQLEPQVIQSYQDDVSCLRQEFVTSSDTLVEFLIRTNTLESSSERSRHLDIFTKRKAIVDRFLGAIADRMLEAADNISHRMASEHNSGSSRRSGSSRSASAILLEKQINVEKQRTRLEYLKHEITLEKKKSQLELDLRLLKQEQEIAVAEAEAKIVRDHVAPAEEFQARINFKEERPSQMPKDEIISRFLSSLDSQSSKGLVLPSPKFKSTPYEPAPEMLPTEPPRPTFVPAPNPAIGDFTSFLLKKDLLTSRFMAFTDQPETFTAWKTSFQGILKELRATP